MIISKYGAPKIGQFGTLASLNFFVLIYFVQLRFIENVDQREERTINYLHFSWLRETVETILTEAGPLRGAI